MTQTVKASDGANLPLDSIAQAFTYSGSFVTEISCFYQGQTYVQTFINDGTNIVYISNWVNVNQPSGGSLMETESGDIMITEDGNFMITEGVQ